MFYLPDAVRAYRHMRWGTTRETYWKLSAETIFYFHKLEKGLCIPGQKRFFGADAAITLVSLLDRWRARSYSIDDPVYVGALECLRAYRSRLALTPPPVKLADGLKRRIDTCLADASSRPEFSTPMSAMQCTGAAETLQRLCIARRSVRAYRPEPVALSDVHDAIAIAQLSPSACNRQSWRVHAYQDRRQMDSLLALQNGNRGFGHLIPLLLIITAEANGFFDGSERNQPYIDAGLFTMTLLLSLQARGLSSCCLNWCVTDPTLDIKAHRLGRIPESEIIIMYLAVGYADDAALVPRSVRRDINSFLVVH